MMNRFQINDASLNSRDDSKIYLKQDASANTYQTKESQKPNKNWTEYQNLSKLESIQSQNNLFETNQRLPEKLLKMKEKIKMINQTTKQSVKKSTSPNLFGRKRASESLEKLKKTYNQQRGAGAGASKSQISQQRNVLQKQNFKEDPFDGENKHGDQAIGFDNRGLHDSSSNKENLNVLKEKHSQNNGQEGEDSQSHNRYKRTQQKSQMTLASYQQKYEKLEKNFKKFTNNIHNANKTDKIISELKCKNGLNIIVKISQRADKRDQQRAIKLWRLNSGLALKQYENQEKVLILAKSATKIVQKTMNYNKILCYQKWKTLTLQGNNSGRDKIISKISEMVTESETFNKCVESDFYLSQILGEKLQVITSGLITSDMLFYDNTFQLHEKQNDDNVPAQFKAYNIETGEQHTFNIQAITNKSILGKMLQQSSIQLSINALKQNQNQNIQIYSTELISNDTNFNQEFDMPINKEKIFKSNKSEQNCYNKVRGLSMVLINLCGPPIQIGVLRLYFPSNSSQKSPTNYQMKQLKILSQHLPLFIQRIFDVRQQINQLASRNIDQTNLNNELSNFNQINSNLSQFHNSILSNADLLESNETLLDHIKGQIEDFLTGYLNFNTNATLKQIVKQENAQQIMLIKDQKNKELVRYQNHIQENEQIIEDFLDYKKDYYVHQISICPIYQVENSKLHQFCDYTFIVHVYYGYKNIEMGLRDLRDLSTTAHQSADFNSRFLNREKKFLNEEVKQNMIFYFRNLSPIIKCFQQIAFDLKPQIKTLEAKIILESEKYNFQQHLRNLVLQQNILAEMDNFKFHQALQICLQSALQLFGFEQTEGGAEQLLFINKQLFQRQGALQFDECQHYQFEAFLDEAQLQSFDQVFLKGRSDKSTPAQNQFQIFESQAGLNQLLLKQSMLPLKLTMEKQEKSIRAILPIANIKQKEVQGKLKPQVQLLSCLSVELSMPAQQIQESQVDQRLKDLNKELEIFFQQLLDERQTFLALQEKHDRLLVKLECEIMSQQTKELINQQLIIPFIKKPTIKVLADAIDSVCDMLVTNQGPDEQGEWQRGQEISQIAYISPKLNYIEEVRLLQTYSNKNQQIDEMMMQSFNNQQQIVYEDELQKKILIVIPLFQKIESNKINYSRQGPCNQQALLLKFVIDKDEFVELKIQNIQNKLINFIRPIVEVALSQVGATYQLAIEKLANVLDKYRYVNYREIIYFMRDLKAKNVYNFSRSRLYEKISQSKRYLMVKNTSKTQESQDQLFDFAEKHLVQNQTIQDLIRQSVKVMSKQALKYKHAMFKKFHAGTRRPVYAQMSKKRKKAICFLVERYLFVQMRELFSRFAINTKQFRKLTHPKTKYIASVQAILRNFRIIRHRLAFLRLKKNLNLQLRDSMASYKENDKDLFIQLNQILVSSYSQQGGLEGGFTYALGEIFQYLKNLSLQELQIKAYGNLANDAFVGHIDEAVLSMKADVFTSHLQAPSLSQNKKIRIFISNFTNPSNQNNTQQNKPIRISYDSGFNLSQQDQILNQINLNHIDNKFERESQKNWQENELERQFSGNFQKFVISSKRDLIHQMLLKSNGIIFNFQNIQQSLSDIFLSQQSHLKDKNIGNRIAIVRRSKSALIIPLFDVSQQNIIGSFELYRHHQQAFSEETEARYDYFSKRLADFLLIYGQLRNQVHQISQLKVQIAKTIVPSVSLSQLLKNVFVNGPENYFAGASHVLPIIILNQTVKEQNFDSSQYDALNESQMSNNNLEIVYNKKFAFFYHFKDNHIYNFDFENTFIEELIDNGCILEMCQKSQLQQDGSRENDNLLNESNQTSLDEINRVNGYDAMSWEEKTNYFSENGNRQNRNRLRTIQNEAEQVKSVTNELFKHIIYYPVFDALKSQSIIAILEVGFKKKDPSYQHCILTDEISQYLDQFRSQLSQFKVRLGAFSRSLENLFIRRNQKKAHQGFVSWKQWVMYSQFNEQLQQNQQILLQQYNYSLNEKCQNLESLQISMQNVTDEKDQLLNQISQFMVEKKAKLKFLATSLVSSQNLFKKIKANKMKQAFLKWQYNVSIRKIAETAFTRVLEINHRHSRARLKTGVFLLQSIMKEISIQVAFNNILSVAHMKRAPSRYGGTLEDPKSLSAISRSRSRSYIRNGRGGDQSYCVLNNISSLLSPSNLKKIEKTNLYQRQIDSFYTPGVSVGEQNFKKSNASVIVKTLNYDGQPKSYQNIGQQATFANNSQMKNQLNSRNDMTVNTAISRFSRYHTNTQFTKADDDLSNKSIKKVNPYQEINLSQIEYTQNKRDYSPIITTSKYQLKKIYGQPNTLAVNPDNCKSQNLFSAGSGHSKMQSYAQARQQLSCISKAENQQANIKKSRSLSQKSITKTELQRQLFAKQKQLVDLKRQLFQQKSATRVKRRSTGQANSKTQIANNPSQTSFNKERSNYSSVERKRQRSNEKLKGSQSNQAQRFK